ncbi:MAG: TIGR00282 family metallophosphoesterase [Clostridiales bacterium]|jgi:metallophosphoesterase (TIGR00282 family)|nr:TIGR00282 family metallophosphoesterase [Clostridiales bacterium]
MRILIIGDVIGKPGVDYVRGRLKSLKKLYGADFCIVNGENAANGNGITREAADALIAAGVDVITLGNHAFDKPDAFEILSGDFPVIRPANYPAGTPGDGVILCDVGNHTVGVVNLLGRVNMECVDCPFRSADSVLAKLKGKANVVLVDFHADATSEKIAMGYYLDGRAAAVVGTHTHVQTADERVLGGGTAYITDIGMTGPVDSVLGVEKEIILERFLTQIHRRFELSENPVALSGVIITVDADTGKADAIERVNLS